MVLPLQLKRFDSSRPLEVYVHRGTDSGLGLYSRDNRRLVAFLMFQVTRRDELFKVHCVLGDTQNNRRWQEGYSTTSAGLAIWSSRSRIAAHNGVEMFLGADTIRCRGSQRLGAGTAKYASLRIQPRTVRTGRVRTRKP